MLYTNEEIEPRRRESFGQTESAAFTPNIPDTASLPQIVELGPKRRYVYIWECCSCGHSRINIMVNACPSCGITRCAYCQTTKIQPRSAGRGSWNSKTSPFDNLAYQNTYRRISKRMVLRYVESAVTKDKTYTVKLAIGLAFHLRYILYHGKAMGSTALDFYEKKWNPKFLKNRKFNDDWSRSYLESKRELDIPWDWVDLLFHDCPATASYKFEELKECCREVVLDVPIGPSGTPGRVWLDERSCATPENISLSRDHKNPLNSAQLHECLKLPRIGCSEASNADRRLIYIERLRASDIRALAETAAFREVGPLREALWKHFTRQISLRVTVPSKGYLTFRLELHLKFFTLRTSPPPDDSEEPIGAQSKSLGRWTDLSFLDIQTPESLQQAKTGMLEENFSVVICGPDENHWVAWAFDDTRFDGEDLLDRISPCEGLHADPLAADGETDADLPIWDPREYFLLITENRIAQALEEWESLVGIVERSVLVYRERHPSTLSQLASTTRDDVKKTFDWSRQIAELLSLLRNGLSCALKTWQRFNSPHGDIGYFSDRDTARAQNPINLSLRNIKDAFDRMEDLLGTLERLSASCQDYANALQLRLTLEGSEATKSNSATSDFTLLVFGPIAVTAAYFSMPKDMVALPFSLYSFVVVAIIFGIVIRVLLFISLVTPELAWWWKTLIVLKEGLKLKRARSTLFWNIWNRLVPRTRHDGNTPDVEMGPVQT